LNPFSTSMMKPHGSPPGYVVLFLVAGSVTVTSDECSARTCVMAICGPRGFTCPPLPKRTPFSGVTQPRSIIVAMSPAGPSTGALVRFASSATSPV
jgi:hypothetical protein